MGPGDNSYCRWVLSTLIHIRGRLNNETGVALGALGAHSKPAGPNAPHGNTITRGRADQIIEEVCNIVRDRIEMY